MIGHNIPVSIYTNYSSQVGVVYRGESLFALDGSSFNFDTLSVSNQRDSIIDTVEISPEAKELLSEEERLAEAITLNEAQFNNLI